MQAAVITTVVVREHGAPGNYEVASAPSDGSFAVVRFAPQATATEITNFLGAYKAALVEGPLRSGGSLYRLRLAETKLPRAEVDRIVRHMQEESKVIAFIAAAD